MRHANNGNVSCIVCERALTEHRQMDECLSSFHTRFCFEIIYFRRRKVGSAICALPSVPTSVYLMLSDHNNITTDMWLKSDLFYGVNLNNFNQNSAAIYVFYLQLQSLQLRVSACELLTTGNVDVTLQHLCRMEISIFKFKTTVWIFLVAWILICHYMKGKQHYILL